jgi:ATP-dependent helicase HrpB
LLPPPAAAASSSVEGAVSAAADSLPIGEVLADIVQALEASPNLVLEAPPGAGKTTLVPLALLARSSWLAAGGKVVVLEPRRLAAKAAARRMAAALGERVGGTVGYTVRGDSAVGSRTRIEVVTQGVLVRRLQRDPSLAGVAALLLDEFHERGVDGDLVLTLASQAQALLRPELRLVVMSATLGGALAESCAALLGDVPVVRSLGRAYPVQVVHVGEPGRGRGDFEEAVVAAVRRALSEAPGDALVFLPGAPEIRRVQRMLDGRLGGDVATVPLYGDLPQDAQDAALTPSASGQRRVVLSTSIAESSLTIPGVRIVVDCGLSRRSAFSPGTGLSRLVTVKTSVASADQRAGRAGRTAPGVCYRLYGTMGDAQRAAQTAPEILTSDLAPLALELAMWGAGPDGGGLTWLDAPPAAGLAVARALLQRLGALDATATCAPTAHGRRMSALGAHPRVAHMVVRAAESGEQATRLACLLASLLEERDVLRKGAMAIVGGPGADLRLRVDAVLGRKLSGAPDIGGWDVDAVVASRVRDGAALLQAQLRGALEEAGGEADTSTGVQLDAEAPHAAGLLLSLAYPDRIGRARAGKPGTYALTGGKQASFAYPKEEPLTVASEWVVAADVDGDPTNARIFCAAPLPPDAPAHPWLAPLVVTEERVFWNPSAGTAGARRVTLLGAVVLAEQVLPAPKGEALLRALLCGIREHLGLAALPWSRATRAWLHRVRWLRTYAPAAAAAAGVPPLPDVSDAALLETLDAWLAPFLTGVTSKAQLASVDVDAAVRLLLQPAQLRFVDAAAPTHFDVPSGSRLPINYEDADRNGGVPELEVRLQEMFSYADSPRVAGVPLCLALLSPAGRPVARTSDLASFWDGPSGYAAVRKDLRGRYPKHPWPEDPRSAAPTSRRKPQGQ